MRHRPDLSFAAVVLAAGASRRMGAAKALLNVGGEPMIRRVVRTCLNARVIARVVVVTGRDPRGVEEALDGFPVRFVQNPDSDATGMIGSVKAGLSQLADDAEGVFVVLGDQPLVRCDTIARLAQAFDGRIVRPMHECRAGHPILLPARLIPEVIGLTNGKTLKHFIDERLTECVDIEVADSGVTFDIDTPQDLRRAHELIERSDRCEDREMAHPRAG